jgi:hypothetical protein
MQNDRVPPPGLDSFWEDADQNNSGQHPLERELCFRIDVMASYWEMLVEAQVNEREDVLGALERQHAREAEIVDRLREELRRAQRPRG